MLRALSKMLLFAVLGITTTSVHAQDSEGTSSESDRRSKGSTQIDLPSDVNVTPEMWMYLHEYRRNQDPKEAIRRKAEFRAEQRRMRMASRRWFGQSKLRPNVNSIPYFTNYGTRWVGIPWAPDVWTGYRTTFESNTARPSSDVYYYAPLRMAKQ